MHLPIPRSTLAAASLAIGLGVSSAAHAEESYPRVGGHVGMALPVFTLAKDSTLIGKDFSTVGITPGLTVHLDEKWALDFEFIALNELKNTPAGTTFVVDPGIIRKFDGFSAGLRVATQVGALTNIGIVPIIVVPFKISDKINYFIEADLPLFLRDSGPSMRPSLSFQLQSGVSF